MAGLQGRPIVFGEVLFDRFADGASVLGGAPFNVAWHLQGFGLRPVLISRVGTDVMGEEVLARMTAWGMDTSAVQIDAERPTGTVQVHIENGQPRFEILPQQAYDYINGKLCQTLLARQPASLFYHGSLAARQAESRAALEQLRAHLQVPVFMDVNLRPPWVERAWIGDAMGHAKWVKLNDAELDELSGRALLTAQLQIEAAQEHCRGYALDAVVLTRGAQGACMITARDQHCIRPTAVADLVDTVGAGDAFSAVVLTGLSAGWSAALILQRAVDFAAGICRIQGATQEDLTMYKEFRSAWGL